MTVKGVDYRGVLWNTTRNDTINMLGNSRLDVKVRYEYGFWCSETTVEVIKEGAFAGTYLRDIYSGINGKWCRMSRNQFDELKDIDQKYYCSNYYDLSVRKYGVKCGT